MRTLLFIIFFFTTQQYLFAQWEKIYMDGFDTLMGSNSVCGWSFGFNEISFTDADTGFIVGIHLGFHCVFSTVLRTTDRGNTWKTVLSDSGSIARFLHLDDQWGYMYMQSMQIVLESSDGGITWSESNIDPDSEILFINRDTAFKYSDINFRIHKTCNRGQTWDAFTDDICWYNYCYLKSLMFIDGNSGWVILEGRSDESDRTYILKFSGPNTWEELVPNTKLPVEKLYFIDKNFGWLIGGFYYEDPFQFQSLLLRTENGGTTWLETESKYLIHDLLFFNPDTGWAIGADLFGRGVILESTDGGQNWDITFESHSGPITDLHFKDGVGWALGDSGLILKNENSGYTAIPKQHIANNGRDISLECFPNPFRSTTVISYQIPITAKVEINICDFTGRKVSTLISEIQQTGSHEVEWNASGFKPGIYFCELRTSKNKVVLKIALIH